MSRWMMPSLCRYARALATSRMITEITCSFSPCGTAAWLCWWQTIAGSLNVHNWPTPAAAGHVQGEQKPVHITPDRVTKRTEPRLMASIGAAYDTHWCALALQDVLRGAARDVRQHHPELVVHQECGVQGQHCRVLLLAHQLDLVHDRVLPGSARESGRREGFRSVERVRVRVHLLSGCWGPTASHAMQQTISGTTSCSRQEAGQLFASRYQPAVMTVLLVQQCALRRCCAVRAVTLLSLHLLR